MHRAPLALLLSVLAEFSSAATVPQSPWINLDPGYSGVDGKVYSTTARGEVVYVGGEFSKLGQLKVNNLARWNGARWDSVPGLRTKSITALALDSAGNLFVGGLFDSVAGSPCKNLARWNGSQWSCLGTQGVNGTVSALQVDRTGKLWVGGSFTSISNIAASNLAHWNGVSWTSPASGSNGPVYALGIGQGDTVFAGGEFTSLGGSNARNVGYWDGSTWNAMGAGTNQPVRSIATWDEGRIALGGDFDSAGGKKQDFFSSWKGDTWTGHSSCPSGPVYAMAKDRQGILQVDTYCQMEQTDWKNDIDRQYVYTSGRVYSISSTANGTLFAGGDFEKLGRTPMRGIAVRNYSTSFFETPERWAGTGRPMNGIPYAMIRDSKGGLYVGGAIRVELDSVSSGVAYFDGKTWKRLGQGIAGDIFTLALDDSGTLFVGGRFQIPGDSTVYTIARWNGTVWKPMREPPSPHYIQSIVKTRSGNLYARGSESVFLKRTGSTWTVQKEPSGVSGIGLDSAGDLLIVAGGTLKRLTHDSIVTQLAIIPGGHCIATGPTGAIWVGASGMNNTGAVTRIHGDTVTTITASDVRTLSIDAGDRPIIGNWFQLNRLKDTTWVREPGVSVANAFLLNDTRDTLFVGASINAEGMLNVAKKAIPRYPQTIMFTLGTDSLHTYGDSPFVASATSTSELTRFSYATSSKSARIAKDTVHIEGGGIVTLTATQPGDADWLPATASATFRILPRIAKTQDVEAKNKIYDGTTAARFGSGQLLGLIRKDIAHVDSCSGTFSSSNTGLDRTATLTSCWIGGPDSLKYMVSRESGYQANILPRPVTLASPNGLNKTYDATTTADATELKVDGLLPQDGVLLVPGSAAFATADADTGKTVFLKDFALSGLLATNYSLQIPAKTQATIHPAPMGLMIHDTTKTLGSADPLFRYSLSGLIKGDTTASLTGMKLLREAGEEVRSYAIQATGAFAKNYSITVTNGTLTIVPPPVGIKASPRLTTSTALDIRGGSFLARTQTGLAAPDLAIVTAGNFDPASSQTALIHLPRLQGELSIDIFDQIGTPVLSRAFRLEKSAIAQLPIDPEGRNILPLRWNLRSSNGRPVASGVYLWKIRIRSNDGLDSEHILKMGVTSP